MTTEHCISVGDARIASVLELALERRPISSLGADPALIEANRHWLAPYFLEEGDTWSLRFQSWVVEIDGKIIVIDPCNGNGRPHIVSAFSMLDIPFLERFEATGIRPDEVDYVFCTHLHHDHCGWNTQLRGGRWVPTFSNARYVFTRREYERWNPNGVNFRYVDYNEGVYERSIQPIVDAGLADLVMAPHQLTESLNIHSAAGHTLGHAMLHLRSQHEEAYFTGDCFHHPLQLTQPELQFGDADNLELAIATRKQLILSGLASDALIIPAHLPFPYAGKIRSSEEGKIIFVPFVSHSIT